MSENPTRKVEAPPVVTEWQLHDVICPKCAHYYHGTCVNPNREEANDCPYNKSLPLIEVPKLMPDEDKIRKNEAT